MKRLTLLLATATLTLTACGGVDGFGSEEDKQKAWDAYSCASYMNIDARYEQIQVGLDLMGDKIPAADVPEAERALRRLQRGKTAGDAMDYEPRTHMCKGWLWERNKQSETYMTGYDEFTYDKAKEAGVIAE
ncbi:hypothetical protein [Corynebacterium pyruviciproducens]|uniref:hypothetical protein n=1 Tax=Corynebacterium pyruviciproducens TaxID=598660 RepID=UPI00288C0538|nr:hypothetical protein [Corynebacterium pyruviciproducens]